MRELVLIWGFGAITAAIILSSAGPPFDADPVGLLKAKVVAAMFWPGLLLNSLKEAL